MKETLRSIVKYLFFYFSFLLPIITFSQGYLPVLTDNDTKIKRLTDEQGLSSRFAYCMLQDSYGFLWFGTQIGLNRYDGFEVISFATDHIDPTSLPHNTIWSLYEDKSKTLWICSEGGLSSYNRASRTFTNFYPNPENPVAPDNTIYAIKEDSKNRYWVFSKAGLYSFEKETKTFTSYKQDSILSRWPTAKEIIVGNEIRYFEDSSGTIWIGTMKGLKIGEYPDSHRNNSQDSLSFMKFQTLKHDPDNPQSLSNDSVSCIIEDNSGNIWITTFGGGLNRLIDKEKGLFKHYRSNPDDSKSIISDYLIPLFIDRSGNLWIGGKNGFSKYNYESDDFNSYPITSGNNDLEERINIIHEDNSGKIWLTTSYSGVFSFDHITNSFVNYENKLKNPNSLSSDDVLNICVDRSKSVWVVTEGGYNKIDFTSPPFKHYQSNPFDPNTLSNNDVRWFCKDRSGNLWIATLGGGVNKLITHPDGKEEFIHYKHNPQDINSLSENDVYVVYEDKYGILWFGTYRRGLNRFDPKTETFAHYIHDDNNSKSISDGRIRTIYEDSKGLFWIGLQNGLDIMDRSTGEFKHFHVNYENENSLPNDRIWAFYEDKRGTLWIGTYYGGLCKYNRESDDFTIYQNKPENFESISDNCVRQIYEDRAGRFWIGTAEGLNLFDRDNGIFTLFSKKDGFSGEFLKGLLEDEQGNLWISSNRGITKFNYDNDLIVNYDMNDGIQGNEFNSNSYYKAQTGEMYFGGANGYNVFNPSKIKENKDIPQIAITDIKINQNSILSRAFSLLDRSIAETDKIELPHNQNFLSFEFASLNYTNSLKNQYKYRMIGLDRDTVYANTKRFAEYPNMRPGKYTFWVTGSNNDGGWNEDGITLEIIIRPPLSKTKLAFILYFLIFICLVYLIFRWRIFVRDKSILEVQVKERTRQINDQKEKLQEQKEELQITIENLRITQSHLVQSEKMASLGQLVAGIAHEINNPVTFISAGVDSLNTNLEEVRQVLDIYHRITPDNVQEKLKNIDELKNSIDYNVTIREINKLINSVRTGTERTTEIVKGLRTFSRLDEDVLKNADIHEGLDSTLILLRNVYKQRIEIIKHYGKIPDIECFPGQLNQVFMNILSNAIDAIDEKGTITIRTSILNSTIRISIKDTGKGIPENIQSKIFEPFFTTKEVGQGTGLGLSICHSIIEKHRGSIEVKSEVGKGSEFVILLPVKQSEK